MNGQEIKRLRARKFLTQENLAALLGVWHDTVSNWERDRKHPRAESTEKLIELSSMTNKQIHNKLRGLHVHNNATNE